MLTENELLELGFVPNLDENGNKISFHPEGLTYTLKNGDFFIKTTNCYPYLWVSYKVSYNSKLISRKITKERIEKALQFKSEDDIVFLGDD